MANNTQINEASTLGDIIATEDIGGVKHELVKVEFGGDGVATKVSTLDPLPVTDAQVLAKLSSDPATQTTLNALLNKILTAPSTEAKQDVMIAGIGAILTKIIDSPATEDGQNTQKLLLTSLNSLIESNNTLINLLLPLGSAMNSGAPALRIIPS